VFVIHAVWRQGATLTLWAEDSHAVGSPPRRGGRTPRTAAHPFAASPEDLAAAVGELAAKAVTGTKAEDAVKWAEGELKKIYEA